MITFNFLQHSNTFDMKISVYNNNKPSKVEFNHLKNTFLSAGSSLRVKYICEAAMQAVTIEGPLFSLKKL